MLIMYSSGSGLAWTTIKQLALKHDHAHMNIDPGLYRFWIQSLLRCVSEYDQDYDHRWYKYGVRQSTRVSKS